jgi:hypothetical protein
MLQSLYLSEERGIEYGAGLVPEPVELVGKDIYIVTV